MRKLGIPTVLDRFIQQAVMQVLQGRWDRTFSEQSHGFRPQRSAHQAVAKAQQYIANGNRWVVDLDLEKFFDRVNHDKLMVNEAKSAGARPQERKFLGFSFTGGKEPKRRIAPKALLRCKQRVRELTRRTRGISLEQMMKELTAYLRGWQSYFGFSQTPSVLQRLEEWMRRRLRSVIWKQWKRGKVRFEKLRQRNIRPALAAQTAGSAHGPWRLANSPALQSALPIAYFDSLGLPRLLDAP